MEQLTRDLCGVAVDMDDILVSSDNAQDYIENVRRLSRCLSDKGLHCNLEKYIFIQPSVE